MFNCIIDFEKIIKDKEVSDETLKKLGYCKTTIITLQNAGIIKKK